MAREERTYILGGETRRRALFSGTTPVQLAGGGAFVVVWMLVLLATRSLLVLVGGLVVGAVGVLLARRKTALGESWSGTVRDRVAFALAARSGTPEFVPGESLPAEVGDIRSLVYERPTAPGAPMVIIHHKNHRGDSWATGHLTATFEIQGAGDGLVPVRATNTAGLLFERLLGGLASAEIPVDQLDIATRVLPVHAAAYRDHMDGLVVGSTPERLKGSMAELAGHAAGNTEEYRSFATVRIPLPLLVAQIGGAAADVEAICDATFDLIGEVARRVDGAGYRLRTVFGPRRLGALIRHLHDPDRDIDDLTGISSVVDGWDFVRHNERHHARIEGSAQDWYHAVAHVPRDAWPAQPVTARWMEHLVTRVNPATIRTVQSQFRLIPKVRAREIARIGLTYDTATARGARKKKQVSTGETEASMTASRRVLLDLMQPVVGGAYPSVRVMVSATDADMLAAARRRVASAGEDGGLTRLAWADYNHGRALLTALPMARGVRA